MNINQTTLTKLNANLSDAKVLVVGDVMLDQYWFGSVKRISPEAPVPVAKIDTTELRPGGAANVAKNIASLGGRVTLLSVVGNDESADKLENLLKDEKIEFHLLRDQTIDTIVKLRVIAQNQQLIRIDFEKPPSHEILLDTLDKYTSIIDNHDVIILSDYGKGGLNHAKQMIDLANKHNKPILIDPKGSDYSKYKNATIITPNKQELRDATGNWNNEQGLINNAISLKEQLNLPYLLVTRSAEGMTLFKANNQHITFPTIAKEIFDVSGAGDTVIATIGLALANNIDIDQAILLANIAAGVVVGKLGTATLSKTELLEAITTLGHIMI